MIKDFKDLPDDSRLWIYQSNRKLSEIEIGIIEPKIIDMKLEVIWLHKISFTKKMVD